MSIQLLHTQKMKLVKTDLGQSALVLNTLEGVDEFVFCSEVGFESGRLGCHGTIKTLWLIKQCYSN